MEATMILEKKYGDSPDFHAVHTLLHDHEHLRRRYVDTRPFVALHTENRKTFSNEFGSILLDAGALFGSAMDTTLRIAGQAPRKRSNFGHYRKFLLAEIPELDCYSVRVRRRDRPALLLPFQGTTDTTSPTWWLDYNAYKHSKLDNYRLGNLENVLNALAAVAVLSFFTNSLGMSDAHNADYLFMDIGKRIDAANPTAEELLFPL
jgi:hypothetical protein